jgi:predicted amidophosphoribosyltransferase
MTDKTVLIIDDVYNTGSTIGAVTDALYAAGATRVLQLAFGVNQKA